MRKRLAMLTIGLLTLLQSAPVRADAKGLAQYIDTDTVIAGEANLQKIDPDALEKSIIDSMKAAAVLPTTGPAAQDAEDELRKGMEVMKRWINDFKKAGGTTMYIVSSGTDMQNGPPSVIVPASDANAKALASLLFSGSLTGPTEPPPQNAQNARWAQIMPRAQVIPGKGAVFANLAGIAKIKAIQPKERPELTAAFNAVGAAPLRLAIAPTPGMRDWMDKQMPQQILGKPRTLLSRDVTWVAGALDAPPNTSGKIIVQMRDAASAQALSQLITMAQIMGKQAMSKPPPDAPNVNWAATIDAFTPMPQNDQLVLDIGKDQVQAAATLIGAQFAQDRRRVASTKSASNIRQLLQTCLLYSNDHKGAWPDDIKTIEEATKKYMPQNAAQLMTNPARPDMKPAYVYVKPPDPVTDPVAQVVMYEAHKEFGNGVNVGFADGHVEMVNNKQRFNDLLAKAAVAEPGVPAP